MERKSQHFKDGAFEDWEHGQGLEFDPNEPPPPYSTLPEPNLIENQSGNQRPRRMARPCVVPQTSHTIHGSIYRPFARAYAPDLAAHDISRSDFLAFIDALNEVWLADPYLQAISMTGNILNFMPLLETQVVGLGVTLAAEYGAIKLSEMRTQAYLKLANEELFKPCGLRVQVLKTWEMMQEAGIPRTVLQLQPIGEDEKFEDLPQRDQSTLETQEPRQDGQEKGEKEEDGYDPQLRRMEALKDYVMSVVFDPGRPSSENWLKRASERQEQWFSARQNSIIRGKREKAAKQAREAEAAERELDQQVDELELAKTRATSRAAERLDGPLGESNQGRLWVQEDLEKELKKLDKQLQRVNKEREKKVDRRVRKSERQLHRVEKREHRIVQKVMWVVVSEDNGTGFANHLMEHATYAE